MRVVLQRVISAELYSGDGLVSNIGRGMVALIGIGQNDTPQTVEKAVDKICKLRIFADKDGKTNLSSADCGGEIMAVSQFTLYADVSGGNRPAFIGAGKPDEAKRLYDYFLALCESKFPKTAKGVFGAHMEITLINDGPFTLYLEF